MFYFFSPRYCVRVVWLVQYFSSLILSQYQLYISMTCFCMENASVKPSTQTVTQISCRLHWHKNINKESFSHSGFRWEVARQLLLSTPKNPNRKTHLRSVIFWNSAEISLVFCQCKRSLQSRRYYSGFWSRDTWPSAESPDRSPRRNAHYTCTVKGREKSLMRTTYQNTSMRFGVFRACAFRAKNPECYGFFWHCIKICHSKIIAGRSDACFLMISCTFWRSSKKKKSNSPKLSCGFKAYGGGGGGGAVTRWKKEQNILSSNIFCSFLPLCVMVYLMFFFIDIISV